MHSTQYTAWPFLSSSHLKLCLCFSIPLVSGLNLPVHFLSSNHVFFPISFCYCRFRCHCWCCSYYWCCPYYLFLFFSSSYSFLFFISQTTFSSSVLSLCLSMHSVCSRFACGMSPVFLFSLEKDKHHLRRRAHYSRNAFVFFSVCYTVIPLYRGSVHPLQDVALRITSPVVSLSGISAPSDSFHLHDVVSPSLHLSTSWSFAISWLPVCDPFRPSVVIESCYMACPFPFLLGCEFDYVFNICFCSDFCWVVQFFVFLLICPARLSVCLPLVSLSASPLPPQFL